MLNDHLIRNVVARVKNIILKLKCVAIIIHAEELLLIPAILSWLREIIKDILNLFECFLLQNVGFFQSFDQLLFLSL